MASIATVLELVKAIKRKYDEVRSLKKECKEARNLAETVGEVVSSVEESQRQLQAQNRGSLPGIGGPLRTFEAALGDIRMTLEVCGTKHLQAIAFSKTYLGILRAATSKIRDALNQLCGANAATTFEYQIQAREAREEAQETLARLPDELRSVVATEIRAALDSRTTAGLLAKLEEHRLAKDAADARLQLEELQRDHATLLANSKFNEQALLDAICALSLQDLPPPPERPPDHFVCPITTHIMDDPVILHTNAGRSYERAALVEWLSRNPCRDPVTGVESLYPSSYTPNRSLKEAIVEWRRRHNVAALPPTPWRPPVRYADVADAVRHLVAARDAEERESAARALAAFCDNFEADNKIAAREAGAVAPLVAMLRRQGAEPEVAALTLWKLARENDNKVAIAKAGAIPPLVDLVRSGTDVAKEKAAGALRSLAANNDNKVAIAKAGAIPPLVDLAKNGNVKAKKYAPLALEKLNQSTR